MSECASECRYGTGHFHIYIHTWCNYSRTSFMLLVEFVNVISIRIADGGTASDMEGRCEYIE